MEPLELDHPLEARPANCRVPLTAFQHRAWRDIRKGAPSPRIPVTSVRILGPLDTFLLQQCLNIVVHRHESLRTRIIAVDDEPRQRIDSDSECHLDVIDISTICSKDLEREAKRLVQELMNAKTDLSLGPPFAGRLLRLSSTEHVLALAIDHIVSDGASCEILNQEIWELYNQAAEGQPLHLPKLSVQFADYAVWQQRTHGTWITSHETYWRERLTGAQVVVPSRDGLESPHHCVSTLHYPFGKELTTTLRALAASERARLSSVVLTFYVALMAQRLNQHDLVLGFWTHGRHSHRELKSMVGFLAHCIALRIRIDQQDSFVSLLGRIKGEIRSAYQHYDFGRALDLLPDFIPELYFNWIASNWMIPSTNCRARATEISVRPFQVHTPWRVHFYPFFSETPSGINLTVTYRTDLFPRATVDRFGQALRLLARECGHRPLNSVAAAARRLDAI